MLSSADELIFHQKYALIQLSRATGILRTLKFSYIQEIFHVFCSRVYYRIHIVVHVIFMYSCIMYNTLVWKTNQTYLN